MYGNETMIWKEKRWFRIMVVQTNNLRSLLGIRRMDKVPNLRIRELCRLAKGMNEKIDKGICSPVENGE